MEIFDIYFLAGRMNIKCSKLKHWRVKRFLAEVGRCVVSRARVKKEIGMDE